MFEVLKKKLADEGSVTFEVKVHASACQTRSKERLPNGVIKIDVAAVREDGKANGVLVTFLSEEFGVPRSSIDIVSGKTSALKRISVYAVRDL